MKLSVQAHATIDNSGIYCILNKINGLRYVGKSINLRTRKLAHFRFLRNNGHQNVHLQYSFNFYGEDSFEFSILENCTENFREREQFWMDFYNVCDSKYGYNICPSAGGNYVVAESTKEKIRKKAIGRTNWCAGKKNIFSETTLSSISAKMKENYKNKERESFSGENHKGPTKLTQEKVAEIRKKWSSKEYTQRELASEYGVSRGAVQLVVYNINWTDKTYIPVYKRKKI